MMLDCDVEYDVAVVGVHIDTVGAVAHTVLPVPPLPVDDVVARVTGSVEVAAFPAASSAVTVITFVPD